MLMRPRRLFHTNARLSTAYEGRAHGTHDIKPEVQTQGTPKPYTLNPKHDIKPEVQTQGTSRRYSKMALSVVVEVVVKESLEHLLTHPEDGVEVVTAPKP